jgi:hypothetical protein
MAQRIGHGSADELLNLTPSPNDPRHESRQTGRVRVRVRVGPCETYGTACENRYISVAMQLRRLASLLMCVLILHVMFVGPRVACGPRDTAMQTHAASGSSGGSSSHMGRGDRPHPRHQHAPDDGECCPAVHTCTALFTVPVRETRSPRPDATGLVFSSAAHSARSPSFPPEPPPPKA